MRPAHRASLRSQTVRLAALAIALVAPPAAADPSAICLEIHWLPVKVHFMLKTDGTGNFTEIDDGLGNAGYDGYLWARELIEATNQHLDDLIAPWIQDPVWQPYPTPEARWRFTLAGVEFHRDSSAYYYTRSAGLTPVDSYRTPGGAAIDLFVMFDKAQDAAKVRGEAFPGNRAVILASPWYWYQNPSPGWPPGAAAFKGITNHEIGHLLSLAHTWPGGACYDTPAHANCFGFEEGNPNCDDWSKVSNNMMDENNWQNGLSPCQLDQAHAYLDAVWDDIWICGQCAPPSAVLDVPERANFGVPIWLDGRASTNEAEYTVQIDAVRNPGDHLVLIGPGAFHWDGTFPGTVGRFDLTQHAALWEGSVYKVRLTVRSQACPNAPEATDTKWIDMRNTCDTELVPRVVFESDRMGTPQLFEVRADGSGGPRRLTMEPDGARRPVWSPEGAFVLYQTERSYLGQMRPLLVIADRCGQPRQEIFPHELVGSSQARAAEWSCDGRSITFAHGESYAEMGLARIDFPNYPYLGNHSARVLLPAGSPVRAAQDPTFAPDGSAIYYNGAEPAADFAETSNLWRLALDANGDPILPPTILTGVFSGYGDPIQRAFAPDVSMDGARLLYNSELYLDGVPGFQDEELVELAAPAYGGGLESMVTSQPGFEYGTYAIGDPYDILFHTSNPKAANADLLFLHEVVDNGGWTQYDVQARVNVDDPYNDHHDHDGSWWVATPSCYPSGSTGPWVGVLAWGIAAVPGGGGTSVDFTTSSEIGAAVFRLLRAATPGGPYTVVGEVVATGDPTAGGSYSIVDAGGTPGSGYYLVEAVTAAGGTTQIGAGGCVMGVDPGCAAQVGGAVPVPALPALGLLAIAVLLVAAARSALPRDTRR